MSAKHYPLEHFYVSQTPKIGEAKFEQAVVAMSPNVTPDLIERLTTRYGLQRNGIVQSFTLLRDTQPGRFFAVHIQRGAGGQPVAHYIILPSDILRAMQGNLRALVALLDTTPPVFAPNRQTLSAILMPAVAATGAPDQAKDILALLTTVKNKMDVMETLLSTIVQNVRLVVQNAPIDLAQRVGFVEGLLALLPPSVRFAVTFAGDIGFHTEIDAQIYFTREDITATDVVRYDWQSGQMFGVPLKDDYSRFTISQLRLDTSLVIERTRNMNQPAAWSLSEGRKLSDALSYASYRLKIDQALKSGQPVNKEDVAQVLSSDPTLPQDLRLMYARYLLRMSLAMQSAQEAEPIADLFERQPDLEREALEQIGQHIDKDGAAGIFRVISRWFVRGTALPHRSRWAQMGLQAALAASQTLTQSRDLAGIAALADDINASSYALDLKPVSHQLLESLIPFATQGADLAERIFLLVATLLNYDDARQFLAAPSLRGLLPSELNAFVSALEPTSPQPTPNNNLLLNAARSLGSRWEGALIAQFGLWARRANRIVLLEDVAISALARHALEQDMSLRARIAALFDQLSPDEVKALGQRGGLHLMRVKLALGDHEGLQAAIRQQARTFYLGEAQIKLIFAIERAFSETLVSPEAAYAAVKYLSENGIQYAPLVMAGLGALGSRPQHPALDDLTDLIANSIRTSASSLDVVPPASLARLTAYHLRAGRTKAAAESGAWVGQSADRQDKHGLEAIKHMVELIGRADLVTPSGQDALRAAARHIDPQDYPQFIAYLKREFSAEFSAQFENTAYLTSILLGRDLNTYLKTATVAWRFLASVHALYADNRTPVEGEPEMLLGNLSSTFIGQEREEVRNLINELIKALVAVAEAKRAAKPRPDAPTATVDVIRTIGSGLAGSRPAPSPNAEHALGVPDRPSLKQALMASIAVAGRMTRPVPAGLTSRAFKTELESILNAMPAEDAAQARERAAILSGLGRVIIEIGSGNNNKINEPSVYAKKLEQGTQRPRNPLEFLRYIQGYIGRKG
ncbi:MAG: hypothetical protein MUC99_02695 [Anaerolineae bacterium]|nr:hypothetical protein [Anaerolineae bacterium]